MDRGSKIWGVEGFKGVKRASMPLEGLSVLAGVNSAGKTSLIQSLLLVAQSNSNDIVLNGPLVRFGSAIDVINEATDSIKFRWDTSRYSYRTKGRPSRDDISAEITLKGPRNVDKSLGTAMVVSEVFVRKNDQLILHASDTRVRTATLDANNPGRVWGDSLLRVHEIDGRPAPNRTFVTFSGLFPSHVIYRTAREKLARRMMLAFRNFLELRERSSGWMARDFLYAIDSLAGSRFARGQDDEIAVDKDMSKLFRLTAAPGEDGRQETSPNELEDIFARIAAVIAKDDIVAVDIESKQFYPTRFGPVDQSGDLIIPDDHLEAWHALVSVFGELGELAQRIRYIGPLREEPQVLSSTGGRSGVVPAGVKGEYTADLLYRNRGSLVKYFGPGRDERTELLLDAVGTWAEWLGVGEAIRVVDQGKLGRGIVVTVRGRDRDLTTIGVGVSQLLPVITAVLAAPANSIVILEQPELHLHPAIQSRLADFFAVARPDIAIIVETHSEYLITRLRRLSVSDDFRMSKVSFLFAHSEIGGSSIDPLSMSELGDINEWPVGFFDTQESEERALLGALTARARAGR